MRRTMHSLFVLAIFATPALAQSDAHSSACANGTCPSNCSETLTPPMAGCGNGTANQLAAYMNSFPTHPNLWGSYAADYNRRMDCLFHHVNGCDCLDPKRNLHSHPSVICSSGKGACGTQVCESTAAKPTIIQRVRSQSEAMLSHLHTDSSGTVQKGPVLKGPWISRPLVGQPIAQAAGQPAAQPVAQLTVQQVGQPTAQPLVLPTDAQTAQAAPAGVMIIQLR
ncbi:MAG: hypothetical protein ACK553_04595 [Planctomycetota bacterium]